MIALFFVFVAVVNDGIRHLMMIWVTIPAGDPKSITADEYSLSLQTALPITVMSITQGLLGLSVTWLEIAESASSMGKVNRNIIILRWFVRFLMITIFLASITLAILDLTTTFLLFDIFIIIILATLNWYGGKRLRAILSKGAATPAGKFDVAKCIRNTNRMVLCSSIPIVGGGVWYVAISQSIYDHVDSNFGGGAYPFTTAGLGLTMLCYSIYSFFEQSNRSSVYKYLGIEATNANKSFAQTLISKASSAARRSSKSSVLPRSEHASVTAPSSSVVVRSVADSSSEPLVEEHDRGGGETGKA